MNLPICLKPLLSVVAFSTLSLCTAEEQPNILFLFTDDQCYETIRAFGLLDIDTPNMDRLAQEGTTFSHAYNMGSWTGAVCVASRTSLVTGASLWNAKPALNAIKKGTRKSWGKLMSEAGYDTYMAGKWHIPHPAEHVFDHTTNVRAGMPQPIGGTKRPVEGTDPADEWKPWDTSKKGFWEGGKHWSEVTADDCIGFLDTAKTKEAPFFMYIAFNAPHDPRQSPQEYVERYPLERIKLPTTYQALYPDMNSKGVPKIRDEQLAPFPRTEYAVKVHRQEYFALITHLDDQIGRILEALEASGKAQNTYIVLTSDHGLAVGHHGLLGKQNMYEHSLRPPFIIMGPGVKAGQVIDTPIYLQDIMPTTLEISGQEIPQGVDFRSILPLMDGRRDSHYESIYGAYTRSQRAIIQDGWKLICYPILKKVKMFNLNEDPYEATDLAPDQQYADKLASLTALLEEQMDSQQDPLESLK